MMRYQVVKTFSDDPKDSRQPVRAEGSSREMADAIFDDMLKALKPGETLKMHDTKKDSVLRARHKPTAEEAAAYREQKFMYYVERCLKMRDAVAEAAQKIITDLDAGDATYQLRWLDKTYENCATYQVAREVQHLRTADAEHKQATWEQVIEYLHGKLMNNARYVERSSSVCSNMMHVYMTQAYTKLLEDLQGVMKYTAEEA